jgi:hypothetical protein
LNVYLPVKNGVPLALPARSEFEVDTQIRTGNASGTLQGDDDFRHHDSTAINLTGEDQVNRRIQCCVLSTK